MCGGPHYSGSSSALAQAAYQAEKKPQDKLSDLLFAETGIHVPPVVLRMFLRAHWRDVTCYAHRIHEDKS